MLVLSSALGLQMSHTGETSWHIKRHGQSTGPVTDLELACLAHANHLYATDLIWCNGMPDWVPAGSVTGLLPRPLPGALPPLLPPRPQPGLGELYQHYYDVMPTRSIFDARVPPPLPQPEPSHSPPPQQTSDDTPDLDALSTSLANALRAVGQEDANEDDDGSIAGASDDAGRPAVGNGDAPHVAVQGTPPSIPSTPPAPVAPPPIPAAPSTAAKAR